MFIKIHIHHIPYFRFIFPPSLSAWTSAAGYASERHFPNQTRRQQRRRRANLLRVYPGRFSLAEDPWCSFSRPRASSAGWRGSSTSPRPFRRALVHHCTKISRQKMSHSHRHGSQYFSVCFPSPSASDRRPVLSSPCPPSRLAAPHR